MLCQFLLPKEVNQKCEGNVSLFLPHFLSGSEIESHIPRITQISSQFQVNQKITKNYLEFPILVFSGVLSLFIYDASVIIDSIYIPTVDTTHLSSLY